MDQQTLFGGDEPREQQFSLPDGGHIGETALRQAGRERQIEVMRHWFENNYEDPVHSCPYITAEGGYQYIWGGPYDAQEELDNEFSGIVPDEIIQELAHDLWDISATWSGRPDASVSAHLDDYLFRSIAEAPTHFENFRSSIISIKRLMETKVEPADRQCFLRLLYVNVITALETYLSDNFIQCLNADHTRLRKFVETTPEFQTEKIALSDVFKASEEIEKKTRAHLLELVWHRFEKVKPMFRDTLAIEFPSDMGELFKAVLIRHDLVHRNGKTKNGTEHVLNEDAIEKLIQKAESLVSHIEAQQQTA